VAEADAAAESWATQFQQRGVAEDAPTVEIDTASEGLTDAATGELRIPKLLAMTGLAESAGDATRKLAANAVSLNGAKIAARTLSREALGDSPVLRLGKRQVRVVWV